MPYIYHSFTSTKADGNDATKVRASNWNAALKYGNSSGTGPSATTAKIREILTTNRTYYIRTDGNDSNDGLSNTAAGAFLTPQHAINVLEGEIDRGLSSVTLHFGTGNWTGGPYVISNTVGGNYDDVIIEGDGSANTTISLWAGFNSGFELKSIALDEAMGGFAGLVIGELAEVVVNDADVLFKSGGIDIYAYDHGAFSANANYTISGNKSIHFFGDFFTRYNMLGARTITCTGTPNFSTAFFSLYTHASVNLSNWSTSGSATGKKFIANGTHVVIAGSSAEINAIPGDTDGTFTVSQFDIDQIAAAVPQLLADRTYFVSTTGSDSNDGLTVGNAFATIQHAIDIVVHTLNLGGYFVTISVGTGTFSAANVIDPWIGGGGIIIDGNGASNTTLDSTGDVFDINSGSYNGSVTFKNFKLSSTGNFGIRILGNCTVVSGSGMEYGSVSGNAQISLESPGAILLIDQAYTISGGAPYHIRTQFNAAAQVTRGMTVTLSGSPVFSNAFVDAVMGGIFYAAAATTYSGLTGAASTRYTVSLNGVINTQGGGANYFPGDTPGSSATGGQYI